jgi:AraC family transcriptional regulator, regulatory protein of adaptative response / methylated-DNA-[protein]-cysteine methyltransferase
VAVSSRTRKNRVAAGAGATIIIPMSTEPAFVDSRDFARIARAIRFIDDNFRSQPRLTRIAASARLSEFHFNRLFRRWAGITPRQYLAFVTGRAARGALINDSSVLDAAYGVGLSGPGRLHDLMVTLEAMTPGELKARGRDMQIRYGFTGTPFGRALIGSTARGVCYLAFVESGAEREAVAALEHRWPYARLARDEAAAAALAARIWGSSADPATPLKVAVKGTNFQLKVWQALLELGSAGPTTYTDLANAVGIAGGGRAVGQAVSANPVAWLIPCHNVLRRDGTLGGYQWGEDRKRAMLAWQALPKTPRSPDDKRRLEAPGALSHAPPAT